MITKKLIKINITKKDFFLQYLYLNKTIFENVLSTINKTKTTLTDLELQLLALFLFYYDRYKALDVDSRSALIFSKEMKKVILDESGFSRSKFDYVLHSLRKKKVMTLKSVDNKFIVSSGDVVELTYRFEMGV